jgi:hypothetical protein
MTKKNSGKVRRDTLYVHLLEKNFNQVDKTIQDALLEDWRSWVISPIQSESFKSYCIIIIRKVLKCNRTNATIAYSKFIKDHGLLIK